MIPIHLAASFCCCSNGMSSIEQKPFSAHIQLQHFSLSTHINTHTKDSTLLFEHMRRWIVHAAEVRLSKNGCAQKCAIIPNRFIKKTAWLRHNASPSTTATHKLRMKFSLRNDRMPLARPHLSADRRAHNILARDGDGYLFYYLWRRQT